MESKMTYSVSLGSVIDEFQLEEINKPEGSRDRPVNRSEVNRPGLALAGFFGYFEPGRIQIIGLSENDYISKLDDAKMREIFDKFFSMNPVAVVFSTSLPVNGTIIEAADRYGVPILRTASKTSEFMAALIGSLSVSLAPRITRHGVLVEVYGEGILILGDSGVGKSETAIELVKRGHRLIADDAVEIKKVSAKSLVGSAPELIRHYVELRGIGIVDVKRIFGMGAVKDTEKIDMIINLEQWVQGKMYDRFGLESEYTDIMGIKIPTTVIPVRPGRNLAVILEIAAMNNRQKKMGYDTAKEFNERLMNMTM
ncbi:MAG: HPr(Ser) kinase/phosphatase [Firmicutes bacterium]|uniref:HPr kinase/phosphorylase n=1 Tax=Candidatus Colimorpha enterica TaxID=3083063 RepID=A0AAE3JZE5_9BACT|nr:HPr(Ser) kinase/phosphatase [Candidatus Colimorpha enterica]MCI5754877.1 HPr(Ser) kinase/phosphatase [Candidatus Colimorpha enterica]